MVTGAGKGIGLAITRALVAEGVHVVAGSRTLSPELESLQSGGAVTFVGVDLASVEGSTRLLEVAAARGDPPRWREHRDDQFGQRILT